MIWQTYYSVVFVEFAAMPLVHTAFMTAAMETVTALPVLDRRIRVDEELLLSKEEYRKLMRSKRRLLP